MNSYHYLHEYGCMTSFFFFLLTFVTAHRLWVACTTCFCNTMSQSLISNDVTGPIGRASRIHRLHLCWGVKLQQRVSCIWRWRIWRWGSCNSGALGNAEHPFIATAPWSSLVQCGSTWQGLIYESNRSVWHLNCTYSELNCLKWNCLYV